MELIRRALTRTGVLTASPIAFSVPIAYGALWALFEGLTWGGVATLAVWMMTLFIQRAEHRDTQAIHAKLDELLRVTDAARDKLTHIDEEEPEEIEAQRGSEG
jgi:low affinity Fe/Cu permease